MRSLEELKDIHYPEFPTCINVNMFMWGVLVVIVLFAFMYFYTRKTLKKDTLKELKDVFESKNDNFDKIKNILYVFKKYLSVCYPETRGFSEEKMFLFLKNHFKDNISDEIVHVLREGKFYSPCEVDNLILNKIYDFVLDWMREQK